MRTVIYIIVYRLFSIMVCVSLVGALILHGQFLKNTSAMNPSETESVLMQIGRNQKSDVLIMGTSHGRVFFRNTSLKLTRTILGENTNTISSGGACVVPELTLLKTYLQYNNTTRNIVYFVDPWCFYSDRFNSEFWYEKEPFDIFLLSNMIKTNAHNKAIKRYISHAISKKYLSVNESQSLGPPNNRKLEEKNIIKRLHFLYRDSDKVPKKSVVTSLYEITDMAIEKQIRLIYILPSTLYNDPYNTEIINILEELKEKKGTEYYDWSTFIADPYFFYDSDHLNSYGIKEYLFKLKSLLHV